ncbi:MAG: hypothetical protein H6Q90_7053 [Deltaproteobacteria bacterium]|nr:hypothetical protein [Deltaproteobacteria bacterium]
MVGARFLCLLVVACGNGEPHPSSASVAGAPATASKVGATSVAVADAAVSDGDRDLERVRAYFDKHHPQKRWQLGPSRIDSVEIQHVFAGRRFYYVFSAVPMAPGANIDTVQDAYRERLAEFQAAYISETVAIDDRGVIESLKTIADYNRLTSPVTNESEVTTAAAAVLSLDSTGGVAPGVISAAQVKLTKTGDGWSASVDVTDRFAGSVAFDVAGRIAGLGKQYNGPKPPRAHVTR